jgi:hypothetical protein
MVAPLALAAAISPAVQLVVEGGHGRGQGANEEYSSRGLPSSSVSPPGTSRTWESSPAARIARAYPRVFGRRRVCPDALVGYPTSRTLGGMWVKPDW